MCCGVSKMPASVSSRGEPLTESGDEEETLLSDMNLKGVASWTLVGGFLAVMLAFITLVSCDSRYTDLSDQPEYAEWIGQQCVVLRGLWLHGYSTPSSEHQTVGVALGRDRVGGRHITFQIAAPRAQTLQRPVFESAGTARLIESLTALGLTISPTSSRWSVYRTSPPLGVGASRRAGRGTSLF